MFGIDFYDVKMKSGFISRFFLEDIHITCSYTRGYQIK